MTITPLTISVFIMSLLGVVVNGQEPTLNIEAAEAIQQIRSAGASVMRIAANTGQYEVSYHLSNSPVNDDSLPYLKLVPELTWLNLANTEITNDGLQYLADLPLTKLHLEKTKIGDDGLKHLRGLKDLEYLNIYSTNVGDPGLKHLTKLVKLRKLYVWQSKVSEAGIQELQAALPKLEIVGGLSLEQVVPKQKGEQKDEQKEGADAKEGEEPDKEDSTNDGSER